MKPLRLCAAAGLTVATGAALLLATAPIASADPTPSAGYLYNLGLSSASSMVTAGGKLFIGSDGNVLVRNLNGSPISTLAGSGDISSLAVSADGSTVFAADSIGNAIKVIDASTGSLSASWPVATCPHSEAVTGGRLFYSYGCSGGASGIASVDAVTGGTPVESGVTGIDPMLAGAAGRLVASGDQSSVIRSYTVSGDTLTPLGSVNYGSNIFDLAISPDGSSVAATENAPYQVIQFDTATMTENAAYPTGPYPSAVGYSHNGLLAGGLDASYDCSIKVYNTSSGAEVSAIAPRAPSGYVALTTPHTITFGPDAAGHADSLVYGLASDNTGGVFLEIAPPGPLSVAHMTLGLSSPVAYGRPLSVSVTFPGHANTALTLKVLPNSGSPIYVPVRTNQWGVATASIKVNFTGRVYAYYGGDLLTRHEAPSASAIHSFTVPSMMAVSMLGAYRTSGGVLYYHNGLNVHLHILVGPPHTRQVSVVLQKFVGGTWVSRPTASFTTNQWGTVDLYLNNGVAGVLYRTLVSTPTSVFNLGSHGTGAVFKLG